MKKLYELEMTRNNVTPRAFYGMVRRALLKKGGVELESWVGTDGFEQWKKPCDEVDAHSTENETICKKPFDFQIAYKGVYNVILEFQFDDDERGSGYAYICEYEQAEQPAPETATPDAQEAANDEPEADTTEQTVTETMEESNMRTYKVSFIVDGICQGNMAIAENAEDVEAYYNREYSGRGEVFAVREAAEWEIEENLRRGMPFVKVPAAKPDEQAATGSEEEAETGQPAPQEDAADSVNDKILEAAMEFLKAKMYRMDGFDELFHLMEVCEAVDVSIVDVIAVEKSILRHFVKLYGIDGWSAYCNFRAA